MIAPATGANNVIVTLTGAPVSFFNVGVASYTGCRQGLQPDNFGTAALNTSDITKSITTGQDNCWLVGVLCNGASPNPVADSGTTLRLSVYNRAGNGFELFFLDTNGAKSPAGSYALGVTANSSDGVIIVASIQPTFSTTSTISETSPTTETVSKIPAHTISETSPTTETLTDKFGFVNTSKNNSTWTNLSKS